LKNTNDFYEPKTAEQKAVDIKAMEKEKAGVREGIKQTFLDFYLRPENRELINYVQEKNDINNHELWSKLFRCIYGRYPYDTANKHWLFLPLSVISQAYKRTRNDWDVGFTDKLWDDFFKDDHFHVFDAQRWAAEESKAELTKQALEELENIRGRILRNIFSYSFKLH